MIQQIQLVLSPPNDVRIPQSWSYRLYGWLMSQISSEFGEQMHLQGEHPIAHSLYYSQEKNSLIWTVNLLNDAVRQAVSPVLESAKEIPLHELALPVLNCTPFVRQYGILFKKWGVFVCRKRKSKRHIVENSK